MRSDSLSPPWLTLALLFWLLNVALHLEFSNWLTLRIPSPFGEFMPRDLAEEALLLLLAALLAGLVNRHVRSARPALTSLAWVLLLALMGAAALLLMTTRIEIIHFPQYAALAWLLARALDSRREHWPLLSLALLGFWLGVVDELNQYFFLTPSNNTYMDFNDFVLNLIGILAGLLFYYGYRREGPTPAPSAHRRRLRVLVGGLWAMSVLLVIALALAGRLIYSPGAMVEPGGIVLIDGVRVIALQREPGLLSTWLTGFTNPRYYVMGALECALAVLGLLGLAWGYRYRLLRDSRTDQSPR